MKKNYFNESFDLFLNSFKKINIDFIYVLVYDLLFYLITGLVFFIWFILLNNQYSRLLGIDLANMFALGITYAERSVAIMKGFFLFVILSAIILTIFIILNLSLFKGLIWSRICREKFTIKFFIKFLLLNAIWIIIWLIAAVIIAVGVKVNIAQYLIILLAIVFVYFTIFLYMFFTKNKKLKAIKDAFKFGITKVHYFVLPYILVILVFILISQLYWLYRFLPYKIGMIVTSLILLGFLAWFRLYIYSVFSATLKVK